MAILNITYNGMSLDYPFDVDTRMSDHDIRRVAVEVVRSGELPGLHIANLADGAFDHYVVDRMHRRAGKDRIYLRPKVPFGTLSRPGE
jgi:hypothetical protein